MRVVVELRRDADPEKVLGDLQRRTALQSNFGPSRWRWLMVNLSSFP